MITLCSAARELFDDSVEVCDSAASGGKNIECSRVKKRNEGKGFSFAETTTSHPLTLCALMVSSYKSKI